jgi:hypothetical protein
MGTLFGCRSTPEGSASAATDHGPATMTSAPVENIFTSPTLPGNIRRVVLLPAYYDAFDERVHHFLDELWMQAVQRQNRFETILLDRGTVADWSGQSQWPSTGPLPNELRHRIHQTYQPDAILLCDVTRLESYQPLEIGLRTKLFSWTDGAFLWGVDGVWTQNRDGEVEARPAGLAAIFKNSRKNSAKSLDLASVSPRYFYYHLVESVALTLPKRQVP